MPELPEAETIARQLHAQLAGQRFGPVAVLRPDVVRSDQPLERVLQGRSIDRVWRRAKRVVIDVAGGTRLVVRLGMTGRLFVCSVKAPVEKHTHLRARIGGVPLELRFQDARRFGGISASNGREGPERDELTGVGIEPLDATPASFRAVLARRRQIKALLMDQAAVAGLGNIYCDESLHRAGIHPLVRADRLSLEATAGLLRAIKATLRRAIRFNGSTLMDYRDADGREGSFQRQHRVYQREGKLCRTCGTPIRRILAAGRSTFYCPVCQPRSRRSRRR